MILFSGVTLLFFTLPCVGLYQNLARHACKVQVRENLSISAIQALVQPMSLYPIFTVICMVVKKNEEKKKNIKGELSPKTNVACMIELLLKSFLVYHSTTCMFEAYCRFPKDRLKCCVTSALGGVPNCRRNSDK